MPPEILQVGCKEWKDFLVGNFFDKKLPFFFVKEALQRHWKELGSFSLMVDKDLFFIKFEELEKRQAALEFGQLYISGKLFMIR